MLREYHAARYPFLWAETTEEDRITREARAKVPESVKFFSWDLVAGFEVMTKYGSTWKWEPLFQASPAGQPPTPQTAQMAAMKQQQGNPQKALELLTGMEENSIFFMKDFHRFLDPNVQGSTSIIRQAINIKDHLKGNAKTVVFLAPQTVIPLDLANDITKIDFLLPDRKALQHKMETVIDDNIKDFPNCRPENPEKAIDAMLGMTLEAAENALAFSLVKTDKINVRVLMDQRATYLQSGGVLQYGKFTETLDDLYGLENMKEFALGTCEDPESNGILIYSPPGCGKSSFGKAFANAVQRAMLIAKFSALRDKYQGRAEAKTSWMFKTIEAFGRPIIFVDEIDKILAGTGSSDTDGGVGQRILSDFLIHMVDRPPGGAYWICTCNSLDDILHLSGGALASRFDAIFFVDMPTQKEAQEIAKIWNRLKGVQIPMNFNFEGYTGRDIAKLAKQMKMLKCDAEKASRFIIPYGKANPEELTSIRSKATGVCIWANKPEESSTMAPKRKVSNLKLN